MRRQRCAISASLGALVLCRGEVLRSRARAGDHALVNEAWPEGWDIDRVRSMGLPTAQMMEPGTPVVVEVRGGHQPMAPRLAISCDGDYHLVLDNDDGLWYMGHDVGGTVVCWASYGADLKAAIEAL